MQHHIVEKKVANYKKLSILRQFKSIPAIPLGIA
jgi:hypothetical protein